MSVTGEVSFEALGRNWTAVFDTNTICRVEDRLDKGIGEVAGVILAGGRIGYIRTVLWAVMVQCDPKITEAKVGEAMDEIGFERAGELLGEAFKVAFPKSFAEQAAAAEAEAGGGEADPPRKPAGRRGGTGNTSSEAGAS